MSITGILLAAVIVGATGCIIGFFLCFSAEKFKVEVDPKEEAVLGVLPGQMYQANIYLFAFRAVG